MFWQGFFKNIGECEEALRLEQLVRRWVLFYVCGHPKKLSRTPRLRLRSEKQLVLKYIANRLDMTEFAYEPRHYSGDVKFEWQENLVSDLEYRNQRSSFHYCCFILSMMETIHGNPSYGAKFGEKLSAPPWPEIDLAIFLGKFPWKNTKENLSFYFSGF